MSIVILTNDTSSKKALLPPRSGVNMRALFATIGAVAGAMRRPRNVSESSAAALDGRAGWIAAGAALAILTIAYGAPLISVVALKTIAAELGTSRAAPAAAGSFVYIGAGVGGIAAGWLAGRLGVRRIVLFGAVMVAAGLFVSPLSGLSDLYLGHGLLIGLFGTSCMLSPLITYVSLWFERYRGAAVALVSSGQSVAGALWPLLFEAGIGRFGWRHTMQLFGLFALVAISLLAIVFLHAPPRLSSTTGARQTPEAGTKGVGLSPNIAMAGLMAAIFCCCVPMNMPLQHIVAFCGDIGIASQKGAAMLSVLLGTAFLARQCWGWVADRVGGLQTLVWSSVVQAVALSGFLVTQDSTLLFTISSAFGFGLSGLLPAYVVAVREYSSAKEANWRVPSVLFAGFLGMAAGGWGAGALYDHFGFYLPAFAIGVLFNTINLAILLWLVLYQRSVALRTAAA
jgi:MFS family permease